MKTAEDYMKILKKTPGLCLEDVIEQAQKEAYNQALEDAVEAASCEYEKDYLTGEIDKQSILKLKK
jgi:hypothetical protein